MKFLLTCFCTAVVLIAVSPLARAYPQYHDISDTAAAQAEAKQRNLPLAYLGSYGDSLTKGSPEQGSTDELTQMALATLQDNAVVIFFDGGNMAPVPMFIHMQYHIQDDGPLPGGASWSCPKVVFCDPGMTKILGRVSFTQMKAGRDVPLLSAIQVIKNDPQALVPLPPKPVPPPVASSDPTPDEASTPQLANVTDVNSFMEWLKVQNPIMLGGIGLCGIAILFWMFRPRRY